MIETITVVGGMVGGASIYGLYRGWKKSKK